MKKKIFTIVALLGLSMSSSAQLKFQKTYGGGSNEEAYTIDTTRDGGYIIGGYTMSTGNGGKDAYVLKIDASGSIQWSKTFGGPLDDVVVNIHQTFDGGYIMTGYMDNDTNFFISKMDSGGGILFTKYHDSFDNGVSSKVIQTRDSNYVAVSTYGSLPFLEFEYAKFNNNGDTLWVKRFKDGFGGAVAELPNGELIIITVFYAFPDSAEDIMLCKTTSAGNILWSEAIGKGQSDGAFGIEALQSGHFFISGSSSSSPIGMMDMFFIETDNNGNILWSKNYGQSGKYYRSVNGTVDFDNGFISEIFDNAQNNASNMGLLKTDPSGNVLWSRRYGGVGEDNSYVVKKTRDNGYILAGYTRSFGAGGKDIYIVKTDSLGNSGCNESGLTMLYADWNATVTSVTLIPNVPALRIDAAFTINSFAVSEGVVCSSVGINEPDNPGTFFIAPNPTMEQCIITFESKVVEGTIDIYSVWGQNVLKENILNETKKNVNLKNISKGIYFVKIFDGKKSYCKKIIIEHD